MDDEQRRDGRGMEEAEEREERGHAQSNTIYPDEFSMKKSECERSGQ